MKAKKEAKKALKKLRKKAKAMSPSRELLSSLENVNPNSDSGLKRTNQVNNSAIKQELKELAGQAAVSAASELIQPLNPIISWFNDAPKFDIPTHQSNGSDPSHQFSNVIALSSNNSSSAIGRLPLKSPPCKKCPALQSGLCKCAQKKFKLTAA